MSGITVQIGNKDLSGGILPTGLDLTVTRYSNHAVGGPYMAEIEAQGSEYALWSLVNMLRCPVEIYSAHTVPVWWGYIHEIEIRLKRLTVGVSLSDLYNRVAVAYSYAEPGEVSVGERRTTAWKQDDESVREYGIKELLYTTSGSTPDHALAARDMLLTQKARPVQVIEIHASDQSPGARITCRGWWETLEWRYYQQSGTAEIDTAVQAQAIAEECGQFFSLVELDRGLTSGVVVNQFRDGDGTGAYEIEELLTMGTARYRRMLAIVDQQRRVLISEEPLPNTPHLISTDGELRDEFAVPVRKEHAPAGMWAKLHDVIPGNIDSERLADPSLLFVEESEYETASDRLNLTTRDSIDLWQVGRILDG